MLSALTNISTFSEWVIGEICLFTSYSLAPNEGQHSVSILFIQLYAAFYSQAAAASKHKTWRDFFFQKYPKFFFDLTVGKTNNEADDELRPHN